MKMTSEQFANEMIKDFEPRTPTTTITVAEKVEKAMNEEVKKVVPEAKNESLKEDLIQDENEENVEFNNESEENENE